VLSKRPICLALRWFQKNIMQRGNTTAGVTIAQIPNPQGHPGPSKTSFEIGPPAQVAKMNGEVAKESMRERFLREVVSEMKTVRQ
jgi:hypothetical protein